MSMFTIKQRYLVEFGCVLRVNHAQYALTMSNITQISIVDDTFIRVYSCLSIPSHVHHHTEVSCFLQFSIPP